MPFVRCRLQGCPCTLLQFRGFKAASTGTIRLAVLVGYVGDLIDLGWLYAPSLPGCGLR